MRTIAQLIDAIRARHSFEPATADAAVRIERFEANAGYRLPDDMREFYLGIDRAALFGSASLLPVESWPSTGAALRGPEWAEYEPAPWFAFCDTCDGNWVAIDLAQNAILDCDHEDLETRRVIASSYREFLERSLRADGDAFYLESGFEPLALIKVPERAAPLGWLRETYRSWSTSPEIGPDRCRRCERLCIQHSVHCRRHHFEAIQGTSYPFDD
jgi:cell wall assembly regulator SMI1